MKTKSFFVGIALCALCVGCQNTTGLSKTSKVKPQWQRVTVHPKEKMTIKLEQKMIVLLFPSMPAVTGQRVHRDVSVG